MAEIAEMRRMKVLAEQLRKERAQKRRRFTERSPDSLLDYFCQLNPEFLRPYWLSPIANLFERAMKGEAVRAIVSAPPQHGKTQLCQAGICRIVERFPKKLNVYISYSATRSEYISGQIRKQIASRGIVTEGSKGHWETTEGGGLIACGIDGGVTGYPVSGAVVMDDLIKNAKEARSATIRDSKIEDLRQSVLTRVHPGVPAFNVATRWHPKDPSGVLIAEGWENVNLAAIAEEDDILGREVGEALAPAIRPIEFLLQQKRDLTDGPFAAMYQGRPRPRGGTVFHDPTFFTELPREGYAVGFGIDLAYSAKSSADWSICLEMWRVGAFDDPKARFYIVGVDRAQVEAPNFTLTLKSRSVRRPGAKMLWRGSGTEKGSATFIKAQGIPLIWTPPPGDKYVSATAVAAAWNDGRVLVPDPEHFPEAQRWLPAFLDCVANFTGIGDEQDDDVDALGNAHKLLTSRNGTQNDDNSGSSGSARRPERTF
jgi:phage terminase large subunit-like protein